MKRITLIGAAFCVALSGFAANAQDQDPKEYAASLGACDGEVENIASARYIVKDGEYETVNGKLKVAVRCRSAALAGNSTGTAAAAGGLILLLGLGMSGGDGGDGGSSSGTSGTGPSGTSGTN